MVKLNRNAKQVMIDPDVPGPSDPFLKEHLHWYVQFIYSLFSFWAHIPYALHFNNFVITLIKLFCLGLYINCVDFLNFSYEIIASITFVECFNRIVTNIPGTTDATFGKASSGIL